MTKPLTALVEAGPIHAAALAAVHAASFPPGEQWDAASFATQLGMPGVFALIDQEGGVVLVRVAADEAEILTFAVAPVLRRQGRARHMLAIARAMAAERGAATLFLEVAAANAAARALYEGAGFTEVGRRRAYYASGDTAIVLAAVLRPCAAEDASRRQDS